MMELIMEPNKPTAIYLSLQTIVLLVYKVWPNKNQNKQEEGRNKLFSLFNWTLLLAMAGVSMTMIYSSFFSAPVEVSEQVVEFPAENGKSDE